MRLKHYICTAIALLGTLGFALTLTAGSASASVLGNQPNPQPAVTQQGGQPPCDCTKPPSEPTAPPTQKVVPPVVYTAPPTPKACPQGEVLDGVGCVPCKPKPEPTPTTVVYTPPPVIKCATGDVRVGDECVPCKPTPPPVIRCPQGDRVVGDRCIAPVPVVVYSAPPSRPCKHVQPVVYVTPKPCKTPAPVTVVKVTKPKPKPVAVCTVKDAQLEIKLLKLERCHHKLTKHQLTQLKQLERLCGQGRG